MDSCFEEEFKYFKKFGWNYLFSNVLSLVTYLFLEKIKKRISLSASHLDTNLLRGIFSVRLLTFSYAVDSLDVTCFIFDCNHVELTLLFRIICKNI